MSLGLKGGFEKNSTDCNEDVVGFEGGGRKKFDRPQRRCGWV
jgi:hypothetical protein